MVRKHCALTILQFIHSPYFQLNCHFWGERARSMISQPTDRCSPCCHCRPLAFIKTERGGKKNGEKTSCLENFAVHSLPFFSITLPFWSNARSMISQPTDQCSPRRHRRPLSFIKTEQGGKKNGVKTLRLDNFAVLSLTVFFN